MSFVWKRLFGTVPSLLGVIVLTFLLSHALPGDPAAFFAGPAANADSIAEYQETARPRPTAASSVRPLCLRPRARQSRQLVDHGSAGLDRPCRPPSCIAGTLGLRLLFAVGLAMPLGVWAATRVNGPVDHACRALVTVSAAFPTFFVALLLVYVFYFLLGSRRSRSAG